MNRKDVIDLGFEDIGHYTIGNNLIMDIGRGRALSLASLGTANEFLCITYREYPESKINDDLIVISNYDYDGLLTLKKLKKIISIF